MCSGSARAVPVAVFGNVLGQGVQGEAGCCEGEVLKERAADMFLGVVAQAGNGMIGHGDCGVEALPVELIGCHAIQQGGKFSILTIQYLADPIRNRSPGQRL